MVSPAATQDALEPLVEPICRAHEVELVEVRVVGERGGAVVRVTIDRERPGGEGSGVSLDDCTAVSRDLSAALDVHENLIPGRYRLEVSSPGLERPLVKLRDFERFAGREIKVRTKVPVEERKHFHGELVGVEAERVRMLVDGQPVSIPYDAISRAHLVHHF